MHVLFVCTGNICRSPLAERLSGFYAAEMGIPEFAASSAGTGAVVGYPMHPEAARVLEELGGDPSGFAARQLTPRIGADADLILTLTRAHRDTVLEIVPRQLRRTFTLAEAALLASEFTADDVAALASLRSQVAPSEDFDIPDPIREGPEFFDAIGARIAELLPPVLQLCRPKATG